MTAVWTTLDRLQMKDAVSVSYVDALRENALFLLERIMVGHPDGGSHTGTINGSTYKGSYPVAAATVRYNAGYALGQSFQLAYTSNPATGLVRMTFSGVTMAGTNYAVFVAPINSPQENAVIPTMVGSVATRATTYFEIQLHTLTNSGDTTAAAVDASFFVAVFGTTTSSPATTRAGWEYLPKLQDTLLPQEYVEDLLDNVYDLRGWMASAHSTHDGAHDTLSVPTMAGALTYKTSLDAADTREWVVEPWSYGVREGSLSKLTTEFADTGAARVQAQLAQIKHGVGYATELDYGILVTMNPYNIASTRARIVHPMQYRDAVIFAPMFWDGAAWTYAEQTTAQTGAPDSLSFMRFDLTGSRITNGHSSDRLWAPGAPIIFGSTDMSGVLMWTLLKEELDELKKIYEVQHSSTDGTHDMPPPGIYGVGYVDYSAGYSLASWSRGVASVATVASAPVGCRLTLSASFNNFRHVAAIVCGHTGAAPGAGDYRAVQVARNGTAATVDIHQWAGNPPVAGHYSFSYLIIGVR